MLLDHNGNPTRSRGYESSSPPSPPSAAPLAAAPFAAPPLAAAPLAAAPMSAAPLAAPPFLRRGCSPWLPKGGCGWSNSNKNRWPIRDQAPVTHTLFLLCLPLPPNNLSPIERIIAARGTPCRISQKIPIRRGPPCCVATITELKGQLALASCRVMSRRAAASWSTDSTLYRYCLFEEYCWTRCHRLPVNNSAAVASKAKRSSTSTTFKLAQEPFRLLYTVKRVQHVTAEDLELPPLVAVLPISGISYTFPLPLIHVCLTVKEALGDFTAPGGTRQRV